MSGTDRNDPDRSDPDRNSPDTSSKGEDGGLPDSVPENAEGGHQQETDVRDTQPGNRDTGGHPGMGVSSERVGVAGPGQLGTEGVRNTADEEQAEADTHLHTVDPVETPEGGTAVREQRAGLPEAKPDPVGTRGHHEKRNPGHTHG